MKVSDQDRIIGALLLRLRRNHNDVEASKELFSLCYPLMIRMVTNLYSADGSDFDELLESLHVALLDATVSYDESKGRFMTYAYACMRHRLIDQLRRIGDDFVPADQIEIESEEDIERELISREVCRDVLARAKEVLSPFQYRVLLCESEGYSVTEIAAKLGTTSKRVENAKYRTRTNQKIRMIFDELR